MRPALLILIAWVATALVLVGVGALVRRALRGPGPEPADWLLSFWLGWIGTIFVLGLWHLVLPVDRTVLILVVAAGVVGHALDGLAPWRALARRAMPNAPLLLVLALATVWLADHAVYRVMNGDSGLYHVPTIRWLTEYPVVPGLGNLHERYAFNQSYFLYAALLDVAPFDHRTAHIANGILLLAIVARGLLGVQRLLRGVAWSPADLCAALFLPFLTPYAFDLNLTNPTPDYPLFVFAFVLALQLLELATPGSARGRPDFALAALAVLSLGAATVKLSVVSLAAVSLLSGTAIWLWRERPTPRRLLGMAATFVVIAVVGVVPWLVHGIVLSGYPLFPLPAFGLPVEWRIGREAVIEFMKPVLFWDLVGIRWWQAFRNPTWLWQALLSNGWTLRDAIPLGVFVVASGLLLAARGLRRGVPGRVPLLVLLPGLASLFYVFATAPFARYAGASLSLMAGGSVCLLLLELAPTRPRLVRALAVVGVIALATRPLVRSEAAFRNQPQFDPVSPTRATPVRLETGLEVLFVESQMCWDAPLPCTPTLNQRLRLRRAGDLSSGFMVDGGPEPAAAMP